MPNLENFELAVVYTNSGKRYIVSFEILKDVLTQAEVDRIKRLALKEIRKR